MLNANVLHTSCRFYVFLHATVGLGLKKSCRVVLVVLHEKGWW